MHILRWLIVVTISIDISAFNCHIPWPSKQWSHKYTKSLRLARSISTALGPDKLNRLTAIFLKSKADDVSVVDSEYVERIIIGSDDSVYAAVSIAAFAGRTLKISAESLRERVMNFPQNVVSKSDLENAYGGASL